MKKNKDGIKYRIFVFFLILLASLIFCGAVSADEVVGGQNLTTVQNGTVSGGVYIDSYYGFNGTGATGNNEMRTANVTYDFDSLPANAQVKNATLYVAVYSGNMQEPHNVNVNVTFNGNLIENTSGMTSTYIYINGYGDHGGTGNDNTVYGGTANDPYLIINDHTVRVTSDYLMHYDVTSLIQQNNQINVDTTGSYDGRIKLITLIVAYDDGDNDQIMYWINQGQDVCSQLEESNYDTVYVGSTTFNTSAITGTVESANLTVTHMASSNGCYGFPNTSNNLVANGGSPTGSFTNALDQSTPDAQASYSGADSWDVTSYVNGSSDVNLGYARNLAGTGNAAYWKVALAVLTAKVQSTLAPVANFTSNTTFGSQPLTVQFNDTSTNTPTSWLWDFGDSTTSSAQNPTHTYNTAGTYTVTLTATNVGGSDTETKNNYITVNSVTTPATNFTANTTSGTTPLTVKFTDTSTGSPTSWAWDFGDGATSTEQNPIHTYNTAGNYSVSLTATNAGGSDAEVKTDYINIVTASSQCDLTITGLVNTVPASAVFAGQNNTVTVAGIKNQGTDTATNIPVYIYASDVNGGTTPVASTTIASLAAGATTTITVVDPTIRPITADTVYGSSNIAKISYTAVIDPYNTILETNKTNNNKTSALKSVLYNGYGGQGLYEYNGTDINTEYAYDLRGDIIYYTQPENAYKGVGWTTRTETWNASDLSVPSTGTVEDVWLYLSYNWDYTADGDPNWTILFNGVDITNSSVAWYTDQSNYGTYAYYKYGLMVFNITNLYNRNGDNSLVMTPLSGNLNALYPSTLAVIYSDPNETRKQIFIGEQCDELGLSQSSYGTTLEEATAYANFTGMTIDLANVTSATLHSFAGSAGPNEGNLLFNGNTIALAAWQGSSDTASALVANVKNYLTATGNVAAIQGTTSGGMDTLQQFLVVEYADVAPVANFTANNTEGGAPLEVKFTDTSNGSPTSWAWDFNNDGIVDSTQQNPTWTYNTLGTHTVKLTVTNPVGSSTEEKTGYITIKATDLIVSNITANKGIGDCLFANEPNIFSVTVKNNGTINCGVSNLDVNINGTIYSVTVPALAPGESATINITDPVNRTSGDTVPVNASTDPSNNIPETNETNNIMATSFVVYNNGYKGKKYTNGEDLETEQSFDGHYDVIYSTGNTTYNGANWSEKTYQWTPSDLVIPAGATVVSARLYQSYAYNQMGTDPSWIMTFNSNIVNAINSYSDIKGFGSYNFPYGLYVYDVTSLFNSAGNTMTITPEAGNNYALYGAYLIVVYQDNTTSLKTIYINDGFDMLCSRETYSVNNTEATSNSNFQNVNTTKLGNAQAIAILASAGDNGKSKFYFNGVEYTGFWNDYQSGPQTGFSTYDVSSALINGLNTAGIQSYDPSVGNTSTYGDNMCVLGNILIINRDTFSPIVSADLAEGIYNSTISVTLNASDDMDPDPVIYYTTNGTDPTTSSNQYTQPLTISTTTTLKFIAIDAAGNLSPVYTYLYTIPNADVYVNSWVSNNNPQVGDTITMTFKIGNNGPDNATGVVFTYVIPENFEYVGMTADSLPDPVYNSITRTVTWNMGDLPVGDPTLYLFLKVLSAGTSTTSPSIASTTYDNLITNNAPSLTINVRPAESTIISPSSSTSANAAENSTLSTVPMQETGIPVGGLIVSVLSILGGLGISRSGKRKNLPILLILGVLIVMALCGTASADAYYGGDNLTTIQNGTVSGGLYSDSYYGFTGSAVNGSTNEMKDVNVTYEFEKLPDDAQIKNATLYVTVYSGNMQTDYPVDVNVTFNGILIANEHLSSTYTWPQGSGTSQSLYINDHTNRVTSDYMMWYDVTSWATLNNIANVITNSTFDGRVKLITLIIAYDDGDNDTIMYWINQGHDSDNKNAEDELGEYYVGNTSFVSALPTGSTINSATMKIFHMASQDGLYTFNGNNMPNTSPQGSYCGSDTWNVTSYFASFGGNTFTYDGVGGYYKIILALLTVNYTAPLDTNPDLFTSNMDVTSNPVVNQNYNLSVTISNGGQTSATDFVVKIYDNDQEVGSRTITSLNTGSSRILTFNWTPTTTGLHSLKVVIDSLNQVTETNETNNQFTKLLNVDPERADLVASALTIPDDPEVSQTYHLTATITNSGLKSAESFVVKFYEGSTLLATRTVSGLAKGSITTLQFDWTPTSTGSHTLKLLVDADNQVNESSETNNQLNRYIIMNEAGVINIFITSDNPGTNIANLAAHDILNELGDAVSIQIRSGVQIEEMSEDELRAYMDSCDIFIGEWVTTNAGVLIAQVLADYPEVAIKPNGLFLILETPASVNSSTVALMKYTNIKGVNILENFTNTQLLDYYQNTQRGGDYITIADYLATVNFPTIYNIATLYKDLNDKDSTANQILWALNLIGLETDFELPAYSSGKQSYGIYRYRWYTLEEYKAVYFKSDRQGTVGLIESTMYVGSQMLQTYYEIIEDLEEQGLNVIPVTAYAGTSTQLLIMVQYFTNATSYESFIANPTSYAIYVDSIVEMAAYGLGGDSFTEVINFLSVLNVPVVRAIHSDYTSNEEWELESSGLPVDDGSKWWHVAILEAQGIIEYTFVGGQTTTIDPDTGAGILDYKPQEENIEYMAKRVASWVKLQYMDNADKIIALIYYNYPVGKDNIGSSYLDTVTSIYNLLLVLKSEGYTVDNIPANSTVLESMMIALGKNVATWAPGVLEEMLTNSSLILYPVSEYMEWFDQLDEMTKLQVVEGPVAYIGALCKKAVELNYTSEMASRIEAWYSGMLSLLPDESYSVAQPLLENIVTTLKKYVISYSSTDYDAFLVYKEQFFALNINGTTGWGDAPGDIMVVEKNGTQYFVIPGLMFGNIFIGPEPQRGWEADISLLYHSSVVAPPHQYLAYYAWLQQRGTDAMVFMGRHATHEWLPGKELVLSPNDFPSICVGSVPQIYFYIVDGLAEGIQAKRRGYAVIISHLTPPMTFTNLYGDLGTLATLSDQYDGATTTEKAEIITQVKSLISSNNYDLGVDISSLSDDRLMMALEDYLEDIQSTLYPYGLHAIGQSWSDEEISLMVTSILSVEFTIANSTNSTTLHNEISLLKYGKSYDNLTTLEKEDVQEKCVAVVESLIYWDVDTIATILTSTPSTNLIYALNLAEYYIWAINQSVENEVSNFLDALNGGYIEPGAGGDPVSNPDVLPTGTNFYDDQSSEIPTEEAFEYAKILTLLALADITDDTEKIAMGIWCVETARDDGSLVSIVLYLLGMEPAWSDSPSAGVGGQKLKEMPIYVELEDLVRPDGWEKKRIDVTIITSGLFRDLYSRQAELVDNAFRVALARSYYTIINDATLQAKYGSDLRTAIDTIMAGIGYYGAGSESLDDNYVAQHWVEDFEYYMSLNLTADVAGELAITRIFAPPEGDYGAGISKLVSMSWTWNNTSELAEFYLSRMANMYSHNNWGVNNVVVFARALTGIDTVFTSRNTNLYGVMDNDDFFDYWGGLSLAIEYINGKAPTMYVLDYSNRANPDSVTLEYYMTREMTTRYFNPDWIQGMMNEGYSGARYMSNKFIRNLLGWATTRSGSVQNWMWNKAVDIYLRDSLNLGVTSFLKSGNNAYSMISFTGTLLTAAYEGHWITDQATLQMVANTWAQMIIQNGVACCDCSCGNLAMMEWATTYVSADLLAHLNAMLYEATQQAAFAPGQTPASDPTGSTQTSSQSSSSQSSSQSESQDSGSSGSAGEEESDSATTPGEEGEGKAYEVSKQSSSGTSESGLPIAAVLGVIALVCLVGIGYFRGNFKGK